LTLADIKATIHYLIFVYYKHSRILIKIVGKPHFLG